VTIRHECLGTVPNFEGLSRKNTRSFGTPNCPEFRTLSRINVKMQFKQLIKMQLIILTFLPVRDAIW